jgi:hypothetical protein
MYRSSTEKILRRASLILVCSLLILAGVASVFKSAAHAQTGVAPAATYVYTTMPSDSLTNVSYELTINDVPNLGNTDYFWSNDVYFAHEPSGGTAYIGLQGINLAVFSVFNYPSPEASSNCSVQQSGFDSGAYSFGGTACHLSYDVVQGHTYRLAISDVGQDANGINWQGTVEDLTTGRTTVIGEVNIASSWGTITSGQNSWTEYFEANAVPITSCAALPYSKVTFSNYTANNGQYTVPQSHQDVITQNDCTHYSRITDNSSNSFTEEMGIDPPVATTIVSALPPAAPIVETKPTSQPAPASAQKTVSPAPATTLSSKTAQNQAVSATIKILNSSGAPVRSAQVTLSSTRQATTNSDGIATFSNISPGNYSLQVKAKGYSPIQTNIVVGSDAPQQLEYHLTALHETIGWLDYILTIVLAIALIVPARLLYLHHHHRPAVSAPPPGASAYTPSAASGVDNWQHGLSTVQPTGNTVSDAPEPLTPSTDPLPTPAAGSDGSSEDPSLPE